MLLPFGVSLPAIVLFQATGEPVTDITFLTVVVLLLLLLAGITAGAETAFFSLKAKDYNHLKTRDQYSARQAVALLDQPKRLMATLLITNTFINIAIIITSSLLVRELLALNGLPTTGWLSFAIQTAAVLVVLVLFGDILPKVYAAQYNTRMVLFSAPVLSVFDSLFKPIAGTLISSNAYIEEQLSPRPTANMTESELEEAITQSLGHRATRSELSIFKGILRFGQITVRQIMRTRLDVKAVSETLSFSEVQAFAAQTSHSRLPVYRGTLDQIVGVVNSKDFLIQNETEDFDWHKLIRPAYFVHTEKPIEDLLKEFQQQRMHLAIVADEFGGTSGIVTLEDVLEEIIGDIRDEFDKEEIQFRKIDARTFQFEGRMHINDACRISGLNADTFDRVRGGSDSMGGLVLELSGRFPQVGEKIGWKGYEFTVTELDGMRIQSVQLRVPQAIDKSEDGDSEPGHTKRADLKHHTANRAR